MTALIQFFQGGWIPFHAIGSAAGLLVFAIGSHTLNQRRHPAAAFGWVLMILLAPEIGVPAYLFFGTRKLPKARRRPGGGRSGEPASGGGPDWMQSMTAAMAMPAPVAYQSFALHEDGAQARLALMSIIDGARERLEVCTFILGRDHFGNEVVQRLAERARDGVRVRLLVDGVGTWMGGRRDFSIATAAGVEVALFMAPLRSPLRWWLRGRTNLRNHRKMVVADGERLWSGGRNLSSDYFEGREGRKPWVDLSFDLRGAPAAQAQALFEADWAAARSTVAFDALNASTRHWPPSPGGGAAGPCAQLLPSGPDCADDTVHTVLLTACFRARSRILAVTPYLVPDESLLSALVLAARRGVRVDLIVPARSNHRLADIARHGPMRELAAAGARLWMTSAMVHAKAVVVDDQLAMAGSANLDSRSLFLNFELMTVFYDPAAIARITEWVDALASDAHRYRAHASTLARHVGEGLVTWLAFQL